MRFIPLGRIVVKTPDPCDRGLSRGHRVGCQVGRWGSMSAPKQDAEATSRQVISASLVLAGCEQDLVH
jgi:hypothetical protein